VLLSEGKLFSDNWMDFMLSGNEIDEFDIEKSVVLLLWVIGWVICDDDFVMDFFVGFGIIGYVVFVVNVVDGGW